MERVSCEPNPKCKFYRNDGCYMNLHHLFYPRCDYITPLEKRFRQDGRNIVRLCRREHEILHHTQEPPEKPSVEEMQIFIRDKTMERIRDYDGRNIRRAEQIRNVVDLLGQVSALPVVERTEVSQLGYTITPGFDSEGRYITPEI